MLYYTTSYLQLYQLIVSNVSIVVFLYYFLFDELDSINDTQSWKNGMIGVNLPAFLLINHNLQRAVSFSIVFVLETLKLKFSSPQIYCIHSLFSCRISNEVWIKINFMLKTANQKLGYVSLYRCSWGYQKYKLKLKVS